MISPVVIIKNVTIAKKINPRQIDNIKIFNGEGLYSFSSDPTPIKSLKILVKKDSSNQHRSKHECQYNNLNNSRYPNKHNQWIKFHADKVIILAPFSSFFLCCISNLCIQFRLLSAVNSILLYIFILVYQYNLYMNLYIFYRTLKK